MPGLAAERDSRPVPDGSRHRTQPSRSAPVWDYTLPLFLDQALTSLTSLLMSARNQTKAQASEHFRSVAVGYGGVATMTGERF